MPNAQITMQFAQVDGVHELLLRQASSLYDARINAQKRAMALLTACLSPGQRSEIKQHGWFTVTGSKGGSFRIEVRGSVSGNVRRLGKAGRITRSYCAHSGEAMPAPDHYLLQKLALESDEQGFLDVACTC